MADCSPLVTFEPVHWDMVAISHLKMIDGVSPAALHFYASAEARGEVDVWGVFVDAQRVGTVVWSIEDDVDGRVLVVNEMAAHPVAGVCLAKEADKMLDTLARRVGVSVLRFWTARKGLAHLMENHWNMKFVMERGI